MPKFKDGTYLNNTKKKGAKPLKYLRISAGPLRGQYVHRLVAAAKIGRDLTQAETIDHKDGDTLHDHPTNLSEPISWEEHGRLTRTRQKQRQEEERKVPF